MKAIALALLLVPAAARSASITPSPSRGGAGGVAGSTVTTDSTLTGDGSSGSPLGINPAGTPTVSTLTAHQVNADTASATDVYADSITASQFYGGQFHGDGTFLSNANGNLTACYWNNNSLSAQFGQVSCGANAAGGGITNNGSWSFGFGQTGSIFNNFCVLIGGGGSVCRGDGSTLINGFGNDAEGGTDFIGGGGSNLANANYNTIFGSHVTTNSDDMFAFNGRHGTAMSVYGVGYTYFGAAQFVIKDVYGGFSSQSGVANVGLYVSSGNVVAAGYYLTDGTPITGGGGATIVSSEAYTNASSITLGLPGSGVKKTIECTVSGTFSSASGHLTMWFDSDNAGTSYNWSGLSEEANVGLNGFISGGGSGGTSSTIQVDNAAFTSGVGVGKAFSVKFSFGNDSSGYLQLSYLSASFTSGTGNPYWSSIAPSWTNGSAPTSFTISASAGNFTGNAECR